MVTNRGGLLSFDTNNFDSDHGIDESQEGVLLSSLSKSRIRIVFQIENLEESLLGLRCGAAGQAKIHQQIHRLLTWCDSRRIAKPVDVMMLDDVVAYSAGEGPSGSYLEGRLRYLAERGLGGLRNLTSEELASEWTDPIEELIQRRKRFLENTLQTVDELRTMVTRRVWRDFGSFWEAHALISVTALVESLDRDHEHPGLLDAVRARGFAGLLQVPSWRVLAGLTLSTMFEQLYQRAPTPTPVPSDAADYRISICATAADVFVTNDRRLYNRLSRIPELPFRVLKLRDFLRDFNPSLAA